MRLKEIKINGIRGFNYLKDETGTPLPHIVELNEKHLFLYGENGTGKSSLFDAIEWCFTGDIEESHNRKIQNPKDFLVNKFCDAKDNPFVEILFVKKNAVETFSRQIKKTKNPVFKYENEARERFIESNRIDNFVIDTKASLWQRFSDLLGFGSLILLDKQLLKLQNESKRQYTDIEELLKSKKNEIKNIEEKIEQIETNFKKELEGEWEGIVNQEKDSNEYKKYYKLDKLSKNIKNYFKIYDEVEGLYKVRNEKEMLLLEERSIISTAEISRIVDEAYKYFINSPYLDTCPVCGQKIKFNEVCNHLKNLKASLSNILNLENELATITRNIDESNNILNNSTKEIRLLYEELFEEEIKEPCSDVYLFEFLKTKEVQVDAEKGKLDKIVPLLKKIGIYQEKKNNLIELKKSLEEIEDELKIKKGIYEDIEKFYKLYLAKYSTKIKDELEIISKNEVTRIYNEINQSNDEVVENFIIEPNLESKEITFLAEIKGTSQKVSAVEFLSTGHLRCLGFALLIARIKAKTNNLKFIVIDDPVYSIDHEHRYNLINYLNELGNTYQLIITSSDRLFSDILRNNFNSNKFVSYETSLSTESGIITINVKVKNNQYIDEARKYLQTKDFRASSLYARLSLETKLFDVAKKLNIKIPFKKIQKISTKDLVELGIIQELKEKYPEKASEIDMEFNKLSDHRYFKSLLKGFPLDEEVHHPHDNRSFYSKKEIEDVINSIEAFNSFITSIAQ